MKAILLTALLFAAIIESSAQNFTSGIRVDDDAGKALQASPQITVDRQGNIYVLWTDYRSNSEGDVLLSRSTDGGTSFSPSRPVLRSASTISGMQRGARIAVDSNGVLHLLCQVSKKGGSGFDVIYQRSVDGGINFTPPLSLTNSTPKDHQDFPSIAVDGRNNIYVAWVDDRDLVAKTSLNTHIYATHSTDGGTTFSLPTRADVMPNGIGGSCECCNTDVAASSDGYVTIAFRSNINNRRDIFLARSVDGGKTFQTAIPVQSEPWIINACPMAGPAVTMDWEGTTHVAWRDLRASAKGKAYIYYATVRRNDSFASPDIPLSDSPKGSSYPSIAVLPNGAILCAYQDNRNDAADLFVAISSDGGNTFAPNTRIVEDAGSSLQSYPIGAVAPDGTYYVVWQEGSKDEGDIMLANTISIPPVVSPNPPLPNAPKGVVRPDQLSGFSWKAPSGLGRNLHVQYQLYLESLSGWERTDGITSTWWPSTLPVGSYRWFVQTQTLTGVSVPSDTLAFTLAAPSAVIPPQSVSSNSMMVIPNPISVESSTQLRVVLPSNYRSAKQIEIVLYDMTGVCVARLFTDQLQQDNLSISLPPLPAGAYRCQARTATDKTNAMIIVE